MPNRKWEEVKDLVAQQLEKKAIISRLKSGLTDILDMLLPHQAISPDHEDEGRDAQYGPGFSVSHWSKIRFLDNEGCDMCARPFDDGLYFTGRGLCSSCQEKPFHFTKTRAACVYDEHSRGVILGFKHGDRLDYSRLLSGWIGRASQDLWSEADLLIPIPLHPLRLIKRRYNQAAELARYMGKTYKRPYHAHILQRIKHTKPQGEDKGIAERRANVAKAFALTPKAENLIKDKVIVLIDDVFTSGATLNACAHTLLNGGAKAVYCAVIARAVKQDL